MTVRHWHPLGVNTVNSKSTKRSCMYLTHHSIPHKCLISHWKTIETVTYEIDEKTGLWKDNLSEFRSLTKAINTMLSMVSGFTLPFTRCLEYIFIVSWVFTGPAMLLFVDKLIILRPEQNGWLLAYDILYVSIWKRIVHILNLIWPKFVPKSPIDNKPTLVKVIFGVKELPSRNLNQLRLSSLTHVYISEPQLVKTCLNITAVLRLDIWNVINFNKFQEQIVWGD